MANLIKGGGLLGLLADKSLVGGALLNRDKKKSLPKKKAAPAPRKNSDAVYRGNTTPVSTLLSGPGRSGY